MPDDSASQVGIGLRNKPKPSECGSRSSRLSKTSSISAARAKEAARIAELRAEVLALDQRHSLQETELLLKRQEYELQLKKDELNLKTEYAKALAREEAYAQAEAGNFVPNIVPASNTRVDVPDVSSNTKVTWTDDIKSSQIVNKILNTEGRDICIDDISLFVEQKVRALSNPVYTKLPFLEKEKKNNRDRGLRSKSEKRGDKQIALVTITDKKPPSTSSRDSSNSPNPSQKKCPFCNADHTLAECSSFAKVPDVDQRDFVMKQRLCFSCLNGGHQSKGRYKKKPCNHCDRNLPLCCIQVPRKLLLESEHKKTLLELSVEKADLNL